MLTIEWSEERPLENPSSAGSAIEDFPRRLLGRRFGQYEFQSLLGKGGMAWVFRARHNALQRLCAIKVLCPEIRSRSVDSADLFIAEARAAASLVHPHIVTIHNVGQLEEHCFIEMEYVPGRSLQEYVSAPTRLPLVVATDYLLQATAALVAAHRQGWVHRDFKPANILVCPDHLAKLADFGLAKSLASEVFSSDRGLAGTPQYMAPELFLGCTATQQSDVYAVGVSYFQALTGRLPFERDSILALAAAHAHQPIPDPREIRPDVPQEAAEIISRCLAKKPAERFIDAASLHAELQRVFRILRDFHSLITDALAGLDLERRADENHYVAIVRLANGRAQAVHIEECTGPGKQASLIRIYSVCAPVDESFVRQALELNASIAHGALAIQEINGVPHFLILNCHLRSSCDVEDIRTSVRDIALRADDIEKELTGLDKH